MPKRKKKTINYICTVCGFNANEEAEKKGGWLVCLENKCPKCGERMKFQIITEQSDGISSEIYSTK